jgi:exodeoxyribonuclease V gamma subunit
LLLFDAKPARAAGLKEMLAFYIDWAALRLTQLETLDARFLEHPSSAKTARAPKLLDPLLSQGADQLRHGLRCLIDAYLVAGQQPLLFFPRSALAYASHPPGERIGKAADAWKGDDFNRMGERDYAPGYAALLSRGLELFDEDTPAHRAFVAATTLVCDVLDPQRTMLLKPQPSAVPVDGEQA